MKFYEKMTILRKRNGYSQEALAEKLGVSRQAVSRWETGETTPEMAIIVKICNTYNVSADYLINDNIDDESAVPVIKAKNDEINKVRNAFKKSRLFIAICFCISACCSLIGVGLSNNDLQLAVSCIWTVAAVFFAAFNFVLFFKENK